MKWRRREDGRDGGGLMMGGRVMIIDCQTPHRYGKESVFLFQTLIFLNGFRIRRDSFPIFWRNP